jgi:tetratricopeptide (TPR) repeat protein
MGFPANPAIMNRRLAVNIASPTRSLLSPPRRVALGIVLVTMIAYALSFSGLFLFDDTGAITDNPTIRHLWPPGPVLSPPTNGTPVSGRPLVNLSFALNYALSGEAVGSYHALNLGIHLLAVLTLFGVVRRTLLLPFIAARWRERSLEIAGAVAALWAVHPLQTESVTYLSQRAEALMGLFYLLTLYAFIRGAAEKAGGWLILSAAACLAGMASKEVMISAPLIVLLYDRTFMAGSFREALAIRPKYYFALAATWILLAYEMMHVGNRGGAVGMGLKIDSWHYALTQFHAIVLYLGLSLWPHPLIFDYGTTLVPGFGAVWPEALLVAALLCATGFLLWKRSALGFLGAWFFAILAPTSSFVPLAKQTLAEHRMYLSLAAVLVLVVLGVELLFGRCRLAVLAVLVVASVALTLQRNGEYLNGVTIWTGALAHYPDNPRALIDLGNAYVQSGRPEMGAAEFRAAIRLDPTLPEAHNLGVVEANEGHLAQAEAEYREALRLLPGWEKAQRNLTELEAGRKASPAK